MRALRIDVVEHGSAFGICADPPLAQMRRHAIAPDADQGAMQVRRLGIGFIHQARTYRCGAWLFGLRLMIVRRCRNIIGPYHRPASVAFAVLMWITARGPVDR